MFVAVPWNLILALSGTGIIMALLSCLVGMRQKVEISLWWGLYVLWIVVVLVVDARAPFRTILTASVIAGLLHGMTQALLINQYKKNNPWYADVMAGPTGRLRVRFVIAAVVMGAAFGAIIGGIAWIVNLL